MGNWATLYRQPTRLKVAVNPHLELFTCERMACKLTRTACANRHALAQGTTRDGLSDTAVTYGPCRQCPIGEAHANGEVLSPAVLAEMAHPPAPATIDAPAESAEPALEAEPAEQQQQPPRPRRNPRASRPAVRDAAPTFDLVTPAELLEFAGFDVRAVRTARGLLLYVS